MSIINVDSISDAAGTGSPSFPNGMSLNSLTVTSSAVGIADAIELENFTGDSSYVKAKRGLTLSADYDDNSGAGQSNITFETDGAEAMRINSSGSVGIGNINPATALDVNGTVTATSYTEEVFAITGSTPALDPSNGSIQTWQLTSGALNPTDSFSSGESMTMMITFSALAALVWPAAIEWAGGSAPQLGSPLTTIVLWKVGSTLYGSNIGVMS